MGWNRGLPHSQNRPTQIKTDILQRSKGNSISGDGIISISIQRSSHTELPHFTEITSKRIKGLNIKGNTIKLLEHKRWNLCDIEFGDEFLDTTSKSWSMNYIKIKNLFCESHL